MTAYIKNISLYSLGEVLNKSIQFVLLPVYAHYLSPADYGTLELTYLYGAILIVFYGFVVESGYLRVYFDKKDVVFRDTLFGTAFIFKVISGIIFLFLSLLLSNAVAPLMFSIPEGAYLLRLISISVFVKSLAEIPLKTLVVEKRAIRYLINNTLYLLVTLSSTIFFVVVQKMKVEGVLYGQILGATVQIITLMYSEWKKTFFAFSVSSLKSMLSFSLFLIPTQMASFINYWSNRLFLIKYSNLEEVGIFSFGYKIASIIPLLLTQPIKKAIGPEIYESIDDPDECKSRIRHFTLVVLILLSSVALILATFSKELIEFMASNAYQSSFEVVFVLSMGYVLIGLAGIVVTTIHIKKKTWLILLTWGLSSVFNLGLNYLLVPAYGKKGATYATLLTFLFILACYFVIAEILYQVKFAYLKYMMILFIVALSYFLATLFEPNALYLVLCFKLFVNSAAIALIIKLYLPKKFRDSLTSLLSGMNPIKK